MNEVTDETSEGAGDGRFATFRSVSRRRAARLDTSPLMDRRRSLSSVDRGDRSVDRFKGEIRWRSREMNERLCARVCLGLNALRKERREKKLRGSA